MESRDRSSRRNECRGVARPPFSESFIMTLIDVLVTTWNFDNDESGYMSILKFSRLSFMTLC